MLPKEHEDMTREQFKKDIIGFNFGEVQDSKEFLKMISEDNAFKSISDKEQSKQYIADKITERIDRLNKISAEYIKGLNK
jgi:hypothetical protein